MVHRSGSFFNIWSGNGLLPDSTKLLPDPLLIYYDLTSQNTFQLNSDRNSNIFIDLKNENATWKMYFCLEKSTMTTVDILVFIDESL